MANTVIAVRSSGSTGNTPSLGVIANGELSLNYADGILYYKSSSNTLGQIKTTQVAGLNQQVQFNDSGSFGGNSSLTFDKSTGTLSTNLLRVTQSSGDEGGQIDLALAAAANTSLNGTVAIDIYQNKLRFFETGGTNRGAYIDLTAASTGVGSNLLSGGGGGSVTSVGGQTGAISNTQLVSFVTTPTLPTTGNLIVYNGTSFASLANTGTAGTYANASYVPVITTDVYGRVSSITNTAISIPTTAVTGVFGFSSGGTNATSYTTGALLTSNGTAIISLANTGTAGTYGNATYVPVITTDAYGRVTSIVNTAISTSGSSGNTFNIYNVNTQIFQATANGAQTSFELGFTPFASNNVIVTANGVVQYDYTVAGSTLTLNFTPPNNTLIRAQAIGISSPNALTPVFTTGNLITSNGNTLISSIVSESSGNIGIGISLPSVKLDVAGSFKISGSINEVMNTVTAVVGTTTLDLSTNSVYKIIMAANTTLAFSNPPSSGIERNFKLYANTNNGSNTITWPAAVKWQYGAAPTQTTTANKTDIYAFSTNDGGTTYFGYVSGLNF
jgi:hypothetical protein